MSRKLSNDFYLMPYFKIVINGKELKPHLKKLVESVQFEDTSTGSDVAMFTLRDPDLELISDPLIMKGTPVKIDGGYIHKNENWIDGHISAIDVDFPEEGTPSITVHVMDKTYMMNKRERKKVYKNMRDDQIAKKIAQTYGLKFVGDSTKEVHESVTQSYETDIQFLTSRASQNNFLVYVKGSTLYFKDKKKFLDEKPKYTLWYRKPPFDILSFRPRVITADNLDEVEEKNIDAKTKGSTSYKQTRPSTSASASKPSTNIKNAHNEQARPPGWRGGPQEVGGTTGHSYDPTNKTWR